MSDQLLLISWLKKDIESAKNIGKEKLNHRKSLLANVDECGPEQTIRRQLKTKRTLVPH